MTKYMLAPFATLAAVLLVGLYFLSVFFGWLADVLDPTPCDVDREAQ